MSIEAGPRRRSVDNSNAEARRAIAETLAKFADWRDDLARFAVVIERRYSSAERETMLARCQTISTHVQHSRVSLLEALLDAPQRVSGHSRVADVEKALDGVDAHISAIRRKLMN